MNKLKQSSKLKKLDLVKEVELEGARRRHLSFIKYCWQRDDPFIEAVENTFQREICAEIDAAIGRYRNGESTYLMVLLCFGHGKSNILSDYLPAHFLGEFPDQQVLLGTHSDNKASDFSRFGRRLIRSLQYQALYPGIELSKEHAGVEEWGLEGHHGTAKYFGMQSGSAGKRGALVLVDDFFGKREDADSDVKSERVWERVTNDIMSRRAPVTITILLVTPWNTYDPVARIQKMMKEDADFPRFKVMKYPARSSKYKSGYLFPERFSAQWYQDQAKLLGSYGEASLMQCDPEARHSRVLRTDKIVIVDPLEWQQKTVSFYWVRGWDLASSTAELAKSDPDFTSGCKLSVIRINTTIQGLQMEILFIDDYVRGQWEATERNQTIISTAIKDGSGVPIGIEAFGGYKDAWVELRNILKGMRGVTKINLPGDKRAKASPLVPIFEAGNVYMKRAPWNEDVIKQFRDFDGGAHDDDVDALSVAYAMHKRSTGVGGLPGI